MMPTKFRSNEYSMSKVFAARVQIILISFILIAFVQLTNIKCEFPFFRQNLFSEKFNP